MLTSTIARPEAARRPRTLDVGDPVRALADGIVAVGMTGKAVIAAGTTGVVIAKSPTHGATVRWFITPQAWTSGVEASTVEVGIFPPLAVEPQERPQPQPRRTEAPIAVERGGGIRLAGL